MSSWTRSGKLTDGLPIALFAAALVFLKYSSKRRNVTSTIALSGRQVIPFNTGSFLYTSVISVPMMPYLAPLLSCTSDHFSIGFRRIQSENFVIFPLLSPA
uniref:Uncharacterized protein n=1 Tax=Triticum urartu TaxID=4572 RepID=A0A8R7PC39_TRIUA